MADYQFQPDMNDPVAKLRMAMSNMDGKPGDSIPPKTIDFYKLGSVDAIRQYTIPEEREDYVVAKDPTAMEIDPELTGGVPQATKSNLRLFPPPLFSRQSIPQNYKYSTASTLWSFYLNNTRQLQKQSHVCGHHHHRRRDRR